MGNFIENCIMSDYTLKEETQILKQRVNELNELKSKLEKHFGFEIVEYIIDDILDSEDYQHLCLIINLAVVNDRLTKENGEILKSGIKDLFKINSDYDKLNKNILLSKSFNYEEWSEKYHNHAFIDLKNNFTDDEISIFKKLGIEIEDKLYTEFEHEVVDMKLLEYYRNEKEMSKEDLAESKPLPSNVTREEYDKLLEKFDKVAEKYKV